MRFDEVQRGGLGAEIRRLRLARGWTQDELRDRAEIGQSTISALENGKQEQTSLEYLQRLARAFGVSVNVFLRAAGIMEEEAPQVAGIDAVFADVADLLREVARPEAIEELRRLRESTSPEVYREAVRALVGAFASNLEMGVRMYRMPHPANSTE